MKNITPSFLVFLSFIIATFCTPQGALQAQQKTHPYDSLASGILHLINEHRAGMGLKPLTVQETIAAAAENHSRNMATKKIPFGHKGFDARMDKLAKQIKATTASAENVAYGPTNAKEAVALWLQSAGHKKNIEGDYNLTGIGIAKGKDGTYYYTEIFIREGN